jgi:hypothetical protein
VQYFERAVFEKHPENPYPYDVLLTHLGRELVTTRGGEAPFQPAPKSTDPQQTYFPETQHNVGPTFMSYWQRFGGLQVFGYPLSELFTERNDADGKNYQVLYFERARFEYHPEATDPQYQVLLGLLGRDFHRPDPPAPRKEGATYYDATGHNLGGPFRDYWLSHGGLFVSGLPITEEFTEVSPDDGKPYLVQYFERARYEYHPDNKAPYDVLLGLLGNRLLQEKGWIP